MIVPKYALVENERRFVVAPARSPRLDAATAVLLDDLYIDGGRLRLRSNAAPDGSLILKLAKKYAGATPVSRPMTNLYLDADEFGVLARLPGCRVRKRRRRIPSGFVVDVFEGPLTGLILTEIEADSATVEAVATPDWVAAEVTADPHYDGGSLSRWTAADLAAHRARYG